VFEHLTRPNHSEGDIFTMAASHLTPEPRPAERDASALLTLITVGLVLANVFLLAALASS
jgi:hypothetical protein